MVAGDTGDDGGVAESVGRLTAGDDQQRAEAAEALCRLGAKALPATVALVTACADADQRVREWATAALEDLGPPPPETIPALVTLAGSAGSLVAYWAVTLLGRSGKDAATAVTVLAGCLESSADAALRQRAAWALGKIGPAAAAARAALSRAEKAADPRLARLAGEALAVIGR